MDLIYWIWLLRAPQLGVRTFYKALKHFESPQNIFDASAHELKFTNLFKPQTLAFLTLRDLTGAEAELHWVKGDKCHIITLIDETYPKQLLEISDPPPILYILGNIKALNKPQVAIVGSRNPTEGGRVIAREFARELSLNGLNITSGMASGIDGEAHIATLEAGRETIAVCGTGLDRIYPAKHRSLAHQIKNQGALLSEFAIGTAPLAQNFPRRNRIISGLSVGVLVVEANVKSGSMITARLAADQGKEVFAVPGSIHNPLSAGPHELLRQGATLARSSKDIMAELPFDSNFLNEPINGNNVDKDVDNETNELLKYLSYEAMSIDELVEKSELSPQVVSQSLLMLELSNRVVKAGVATYVLIK